MATSNSSGSNFAAVVPIAARTRPQLRVVAEQRALEQVVACDRPAHLDRVVLGGSADDLDGDLLGRAFGVGDQLRGELRADSVDGGGELGAIGLDTRCPTGQ